MGSPVEAITTASLIGKAIPREIDAKSSAKADDVVSSGAEANTALSSGSLATTQTKLPIAVQPPADVVTLSETAQARRLESRGESVTQIATAMGTDVKTVDLYLGIAEPVTADAAVLPAAAAKIL